MPLENADTSPTRVPTPSALRPSGGTAVESIPCPDCGEPATAHYSDGGRGISASISCPHCKLAIEADGLSYDDPQRAALLAQSGLWRVVVIADPNRRPAVMRAFRQILRWPLDRVRGVPASGDVLAWEGTYGQCHAVATQFERADVAVRLDHVSGSTTGLSPSAEQRRLDEAWRKANRDADRTARRCPDCGAPCASYRRTCRVCLRAL